MIRVPSLIHAGEFQSLKMQDSTFVAYRSHDAPLRNEVFFEEHAMIFVLEGEKKFVSETQEIFVKKGDMIFIKRGYYFMQETIDKNYRSLVFFFNDKLLTEFTNQHIDIFTNFENPKTNTNDKPLLIFNTSSNLEKFIDSILPYFQNQSKLLNHFLRLKLHELLLLTLDIDLKDEFKNFLFSIHKGEKADLEFLLNSYYLKPLSMNELSRLSGRSLSAFKRDFQKQFGHSPAHWIKNKRLDYAKMQLENSSKNVSEICLEISYESVSHFIKAFKERFGTTPSGFRLK